MIDWKKYLTVNNVVAIILAIIGLVWLIQGLVRNSKIGKINSWPKTDARIIGAVAQATNNKNEFIDASNIQYANNSSKYIPKVTYEYRIGNMNYQSSNVIYSGANSYNARDIKILMHYLTPGSTVPVFYNPNNFNESYIYNGTTNYTGVVIGIILLLLAGYLGYYHNYSKKNAAIKKVNVKNRKSMDEISPNLTEIDRNIARNNAIKNANKMGDIIITRDSNRTIY